MSLQGLGISGLGGPSDDMSAPNLLVDVAIQDAVLQEATTTGVSLEADKGRNIAVSWSKIESQTEEKLNPAILEEMEKMKETELMGVERELTPEELAAAGILPEESTLIANLEGEESDDDQLKSVAGRPRKAQTLIICKRLDFFDALSQYPELLMEVAKHLRINDFVSLYAISKDFHETVNGHLRYVTRNCAAYQAPESSRVFKFNLYASLCRKDAFDRPDERNPLIPNLIPGVKWLHMVVHREKAVRDILACMAREGHRMPKTMPLTLKKMWLTMDIATSARRCQLMHNEKFWTDSELYNLQLFIVKLDMRFNHPFNGPGDDGLRKLMLGQRGLTPLWKLLKRTAFTDTLEVLEAAVRYSYTPKPEHQNLPMFGVPANQIGKGHLEGWGLGQIHLYRLDELVLRESVRRNLRFDQHFMTMMVWGYVDVDTKKNIQVTAEEVYMSDDEEEAKRHENNGNSLTARDEEETRGNKGGGGNAEIAPHGDDFIMGDADTEDSENVEDEMDL